MNVRNMDDIQPPTFARNLLIFQLLEDLANSDAPAEEYLTLAALFYVFSAPIMPDMVYDHLQKVIVKLLEVLDHDAILFGYVYVSDDNRKELRDCILPWQTRGQLYSAARVAQEMISWEKKFGISQMAFPDYAPSGKPKFLQNEKTLFEATAMLSPPQALMENLSEDWWQSMQNCLETGKVRSKSMKQHVASKWRTNMTLIDFPGLAEKAQDPDYVPSFSSNAWQLSEQLYRSSGVQAPSTGKTLFDYVAPFFLEVAPAIRAMKSRTIVEIVFGDLYTALDKIRHGCLESRQRGKIEACAGIDPSTFPKLFWRIHMSNVPDYCGGHLSSFTFTSPTLEASQTASAYMLSNILRNPMQFPSTASFNNEYLLIHDEKTLHKLCQVAECQTSSADPFESIMSLFPVKDYTEFYIPIGGKFNYEYLLPRESFTKWLYALYLKLALPTSRSHMALHNMIYSPLNVTIFLRLLIRLHEIGYPAHWLATVLANIIGNTVSTTARHAQSAPLEIQEVKQVHPMKKITTAPFAPELASLTAIFLPVLPFGIITSLIPPRGAICEYTISFGSLKLSHKSVYVQSNALLFFRPHLLWAAIGDMTRDETRIFWRHFFDHDPASAPFEQNGKGPALQRLREEGLVLWSTFEWSHALKEVKVWMDECFGGRMMGSTVKDEAIEREAKKDVWRVGLLKTDEWLLMSETGIVQERMKKGRRWGDLQ